VKQLLELLGAKVSGPAATAVEATTLYTFRLFRVSRVGFPAGRNDRREANQRSADPPTFEATNEKPSMIFKGFFSVRTEPGAL
jgi:hypothetical protein